MSTSSPPAGQSMRQQLDELDALLQRMLNLPVNQLDESSGEPTLLRARFMNTSDPSPTPPPTGGRLPSMMLLDGSAPVTAPPSPPASSAQHWNINLNPQQGSSVFGSRGAAAHRATVAEPAAPVWRAETVAFAPRDAAPAPQPPLSAPQTSHEEARPVAVSHLQRPEPPSIALLPLVAMNRAFDAVMLTLGPPAEWLCTRAGRTVLGFGGLALLIGSVAWGAAGWFGWPR